MTLDVIQDFVPPSTVSVSLVPVGTNAYSSFYGNDVQIVTLPVLGKQCLNYQNLSETTAIRFVMELTTRVSVIVADIIVLLVTWSKTWATVRIARKQKLMAPLMTMLFEDGVGLLSLNVINIVGQTTNVFVYAAEFSTPMSSIIITHFLLNLRQLAFSSGDNSLRPSSVGDRGPNQVLSHTSSLRFGSFLGSMGESFVYVADDDDIDLAWDDDDDAQSATEHSPARYVYRHLLPVLAQSS
ncbi:hypothetical protein CERSUDRAFT_109551 [Gelatoporia subvermispora B]|uniref:Uncharacterized protein n=1 Tax=Ceriporiopsis subvermispora (strain B) TaxID=914234 RepID=M2P739_CERS8|nr:hypothetical protein CERSUDRAFT_109551 [Gelatoporia subvermispora B]